MPSTGCPRSSPAFPATSSRPVRYPVACSPQAWSAGSLPYLLATALGLHPNALENQLEIHHPSLPDRLERVVLYGLAIGQSKLDLEYRRIGSTTFVAVRKREGDLSVRVVQ